MSQLSGEQLAKVFETGVNGGGDTSEGGGDTEDSGGDDNDSGDDDDDDSGDDDDDEEEQVNQNNSNAPPNNPNVDNPLIDLIIGGTPPGQLKNQLLAASPLSEAVLSAFVDAGSDLPAGIVQGVLMGNAPLPPDVYFEVLTGDTSLNSGQLSQLAGAQYPSEE